MRSIASVLLSKHSFIHTNIATQFVMSNTHMKSQQQINLIKLK